MILILAACCASEGENPPITEGTCDENGLRFFIADEAGQAQDVFQATLQLDKENILTVWCEAGVSDTEALTCLPQGFHTAEFPEIIELTLKVPGYRTVVMETSVSYETFAISEGDCGDTGRRGRLELSLEALPAFEATADYRTGYEADEQNVFEQMGIRLPTELGESVAVKFYISDLNDDPEVYFIDTARHQLHYYFVRNVLGSSLSRQAYDAETYNGEDRKGMAGTILFYPDLIAESAVIGGETRSPLTIEYFPTDDLSPRLALLAYGLIEERMLFAALHGSHSRLFYLPPTANHESAMVSETADFTRRSALWLKREEIYGGIDLQLLNQGIAYGKLRLLTPEELEREPVSFKDIAVLPRLPNELPLLGGTITEELQTPLAHVNVAARARGTPNIALLKASADDRIAPFLDKDRIVRFEVGEFDFTIEEATLEEAQTFWDSLIPDETIVPESDLERTGLPSFSELGFNDSISVGAKAANLAELHNMTDSRTPDGFAVPFRYYDLFLKEKQISSSLCTEAGMDCKEEGRAKELCQNVAGFCNQKGEGESLEVYLLELLSDTSFETDTAYREAALDGLRYLIHHIPVDNLFGEILDKKVLELRGNETVRLRSSTNAEDLPSFSGAGLYRSVSAELGDREPSSRIRKVWASVWNWRAFEERSFWGIDHMAVKMAVAVHRSFPDEAANGVLITSNLADPSIFGFYVNVQLGETAVTNPEGGALPEIFSIILGANGINVVRQRYSSLSPDEAIMSEVEIQDLYISSRQIQGHFAGLYGQSPYEAALDMEFKLHGPERELIIKQVRPYFER